MQQTPIIDEATAQVGNGTLYTIQPIPGKGHGLIATTKILKGTRILSELPLFRISYRESNRQVLTDHIAKALKDVDETKQRAFLDLQNVYGLDDGPLLGIARSNVMPLGSGAPEGGLFLDAARINHSCRPNVQNTWNANIGRLTVHAVRDIEQGEEITVSYLGVTMLYDERQIILKRRFGFDCGCGLCSVPLAQRYKSDARIESVRQCEPWLAIYLSGFPIGFPMDYAGALVFAFGMLKELKAEGACDARFRACTTMHSRWQLRMEIKRGPRFSLKEPMRPESWWRATTAQRLPDWHNMSNNLRNIRFTNQVRQMLFFLKD